MRSFRVMKTCFFSLVQRSLLGLALALSLPACQQRLERLETIQLQQARELASLRQRLAEKEEEVAQLEECVDDLENAVYDEDSTATEEAGRSGLTQL